MNLPESGCFGQGWKTMGSWAQCRELPKSSKTQFFSLPNAKCRTSHNLAPFSNNTPQRVGVFEHSSRGFSCRIMRPKARKWLFLPTLTTKSTYFFFTYQIFHSKAGRGLCLVAFFPPSILYKAQNFENILSSLAANIFDWKRDADFFPL